MTCPRSNGFLVVLVFAVALATAVSSVRAQQSCQPRMEQDPALDNLVHPEGYETAEMGTLGRVTVTGNGPRDLVLVAGVGFGGEVFDRFAEPLLDRFTVHAVTLPGLAGTPALPMPPPRTSYGDQTWLRSSRDALADYIEREKLERPVVVGHWLGATQIVLGLAEERPELIQAAVVISGVSRFVPMPGSGSPELSSPQMRAMMIDSYMAPQWFKTVTRATWDDNNYLPRDYAIHPLRGLQLWQQAAGPTLPVWIRYLCEVWAGDSTVTLDRLEVPVLIVQPRVDDLYATGPQQTGYLQAVLSRSWEGAEELSDRVTVRTIAGSRVFIMDDRPEELHATIAEFLDGRGAQARVPAAERAAEPASDSFAPAPEFWSGSVERTGDRYLLAGFLTIEPPDGSWQVEGIADGQPLVARIKNGPKNAEITVQVVPVFGATLEQLRPAIEQRVASQYPGYAKLSSGAATIDGNAAFHLECLYEKDGETMHGRLVFTKIDENYLLSVTFRATDGEFERLRPEFEEVRGSVALSGG